MNFGNTPQTMQQQHNNTHQYNDYYPTSNNTLMYANPSVYQVPYMNYNYGLPIMHQQHTQTANNKYQAYQQVRQQSIESNSTCSHPQTTSETNNNINNYNNGYNTTTYKYMATKLIGSGTFGEIWNVIEKYDTNYKKQRRYAIKMIKNRGNWDLNRRRKYEQIFINEGRRIIHLNNIETNEVGKHLIVKCKELLYCANEGDNNPILNLFRESPLIGPCIVMQLYGYSLSQYIRFNEYTNSQITLSTIRCIAAQIFFAMSFVHGIGACIHSDLKPENILISYTDCYTPKTNQKIVSKYPNIKIVDFGNAIDVNKKLKSFNIQSLWYRSPELLLGNYGEISTLIDMWSIGCILFELTSLNNCHYGMLKTKRIRFITSEKLNPEHAVSKIGEKLSTFPQYVYNDHKSFHYFDYKPNVVYHNESSYIKLKNQRKVQLIKNLENSDNEQEFMYLIDLLSCLLDLNPLTRYTSEDAIRHKFTVYNYKKNESIQDKIHPIIKSCDDNQRQKRINKQINEYLDCNVSIAREGSDSFPTTIAKQHL